MNTPYSAVIGAGLILVGACSPPVPKAPPPVASKAVDVLEPAEGLPPDRWAQIEQYSEATKATSSVGGLAPEIVIAVAKRWAPGSVVHVAFNGGSPQLHRGIERVAAIWTQYANIGFDFGYDSTMDRYRSWAPSDTVRTAEIRIGFDRPGYWSCVGTDSMLDACATAGQQSMNFQHFDRALPATWVATVLHEFGHALGLEHEHQSPAGGCESEFLWDDEVGYAPTRDRHQQFIADAQGRRPGVVRVLGGPRNNWDRATIDRNMRELPNSSTFASSTFDKDSIMKYQFPAWQFRQREQSKCYSVRNDTLSTRDRAGIAAAYPRELVLVQAAAQLQFSVLSAVSDVAVLASADQQVVQDQLKALSAIVPRLR